jgi:hypothetical protein
MKSGKLLVCFLVLFAQSAVYGQDCNCKAAFQWVKQTFEQNDAGFSTALAVKGRDAYETANERAIAKADQTNTYPECQKIIANWLSFFRKGHIGIDFTDSIDKLVSAAYKTTLPTAPDPALMNAHEKSAISDKDWDNWKTSHKMEGFEGIWTSPPYTVGIRKTKNGSYEGYVLDAPNTPWTKNQLKIRIFPTENGWRGTTYDRFFRKSDSVRVDTSYYGENYMSIGSFSFQRIWPVPKDTLELKNDMRLSNASYNGPYLEKISDSTVYLRIYSFDIKYRQKIDSLLTAGHQLITSVPNFIIDVRSNGGGADASYAPLIPYLYTNPIRTIGVLTYSTKLNNERLLDYAGDSNFTESDRRQFREMYQKLSTKLNKFVDLNNSPVTIEEHQSVYAYPSRIGILVDEYSGSTTEQFLLAAKQSTKTKLFGRPSFGSLDISNMNSVSSPNNEFRLYYCCSKSQRLPGLPVDGTGIQPDYYLDKSMAEYRWINYVKNLLETKKQ